MNLILTLASEASGSWRASGNLKILRVLKGTLRVLKCTSSSTSERTKQLLGWRFHSSAWREGLGNKCWVSLSPALCLSTLWGVAPYQECGFTTPMWLHRQTSLGLFREQLKFAVPWLVSPGSLTLVPVWRWVPFPSDARQCAEQGLGQSQHRDEFIPRTWPRHACLFIQG